MTSTVPDIVVPEQDGAELESYDSGTPSTTGSERKLKHSESETSVHMSDGIDVDRDTQLLRLESISDRHARVRTAACNCFTHWTAFVHGLKFSG